MIYRYKQLNPIKKKIFWFLLFTSLALILIACETQSSPTPLSSITPNAIIASSLPTSTAVVPTNTPATSATLVATDEDISANLQKAAVANGKINSLHFLVEVKSGKAEMRGADFQRAEGDMKQPDDFQATVKVNALFGTLSVEMKGINQEQFTTNPIMGGWLKVNKEDNIKMAALLDPNVGVRAILLNLKNPKLIGPETVNGVDTLHYQGISTGKIISPLSIYILGKHDAVLDIWVGTTDNLVRQINLKEIDGDAMWTITFSHFDEPVTIERPNT
jgi:hypothetical protein